MERVRKNDEMKIAMIGHKRIPSREGGIEIVVENLCVRLVKLGNQVTAYNRKGHHVSGKGFDDFVKKEKSYCGVRIVTVPTINKKGLAALVYSILASFRALFGNYDVIHFHAEGPCIMLWLPHLFGIRTIATIHGLDWQRSKWGGIASWCIKTGEKVAAKYADEIIVLSKNNQKYFMEQYGRKTNFIPNGIEKPENRACNLIREKWGLEQDEYILFLGRIVPEKGLQYLIEAYMQVKTDKKLVIAGGNSDTQSFMNEMIEKASSDKRILFTNFVEGETLDELYNNAYLYVLPSDLEGMPLSLLEAMSYGNCCLVSDIPECTEVVEDKAPLFQKSNVTDLKTRLEELIADEKLVQSYKEHSSEFICQKYNWNDITKKTLELYRGNILKDGQSEIELNEVKR